MVSEVCDEELSLNDESTDEILTEGPQTITVYVGQNTSEGGGNGTIDNPYNDLKAAFDSVSSLGTSTNIVNVTINIFGGNYSLNSKAITSNKYTNYLLQSMPNEEVLITGTKTITFQSDYTSSNVNTIINGINFNNPLSFGTHAGHVELTNCVLSNSKTFYFAQLITKTATFPTRNFVNCTFIGQSSILSSEAATKPYRSFINVSNCNFINISKIQLYGAYVLIENCVFDNVSGIYSGISTSGLSEYENDFKFNMSSSIITSQDTISVGCYGNTSNMFIENNWWGANDIEKVVNFNQQYFELGAPSNYAIFDTSFNFLGNNKWEIVGKLTWNDGTNKGIENFAPMVISLNSVSGTFNESNPILKDGAFKVIYTSNSSTNEVAVTLDREVQSLKFNTTDVIINVKDITVGEYANISVSVPANINGTITVTFNNKVYPIKTNQSSIIVPVDELLAVGNYTVDVLFIDEDNNLFGSNSTTFEVKKVEVANVDDVLNIPSTSDNVASFSINLPINATGNLTVFVNNKTYTKELVNGSATIDIADLPVGTYDTIVSYTGDGYYAPFTKNTTLTIKEATKPVTPTDKQSTNKKTTKLASKIIAKKKTFKAKTKVKKYTITLKAGKKPIKKVQVTLKIKGKKLIKAKTNNKGKATFKIKKLTKKFKYKAVIKFKGNKNYKSTTKKVKITVK